MRLETKKVTEGTDYELQERQEAKEKEKKCYRNVCQEKIKSYYSTDIAFAALKIGKLLCTIQSVPGAKILIHYWKKKLTLEII